MSENEPMKVIGLDNLNAFKDEVSKEIESQLQSISAADIGALTDIKIGTVTTGNAGSKASVMASTNGTVTTLDLIIPKGDKGDKGDAGTQGLKGDKGDKGEKGDTGAVGATGAKGATGATGVRGSRWTVGTAIAGTSTTATIFSNSGITDALVNDLYYNSSLCNVYCCTVAGNAATAKWIYVGNIKGATGAKGSTGATGAQGAKGDKGDKGDTGAQGAAGARGATGTRGSRWNTGTAITGTSTTATIFSGSGITDALVNDMYLNTSTSAVYRCTVAGAAAAAKWVYVGSIKGATGATGAQGAKGDKGDKGDTGAQGAAGAKGDKGDLGVHYSTCSTAAATAAKVAALTGFVLATGAAVMVRFTVTNTAANPTLNVNNTGAKAIRYRNAAISAGYLAANRTYMFVYDGTCWQLVGDLDTNTIYSVMTAATASAAGKAGLVPAPAAGAQGKYLRGDGTWQTPPDTNTTYTAASAVPKAAGTAVVGASTKYAREDHVHPAQTSVTGNAGTATKLATARKINGVAFDGSADITVADGTKLPLTGGTLTNTVASSKTTATFLAGNQGAAIINSTAGAGAYTMLDKLNSTNGYFTDGVYQGKRLFQYTAKGTVDAKTNAVTKSATLLDESGNTAFPGTVSAVKFVGAAATTSTAGLMSAADKISLNQKSGKKMTGLSVKAATGNVTCGDGAEIFNDYAERTTTFDEEDLPNGNIATGIYSHAEGHGTSALGDYGHAEGVWSRATGEGSHAEGEYCDASGTFSHAEGQETIASGGFGSHAEGSGATASGDSGHAEGNCSHASGMCSHAEGTNTIAAGTNSHAEGNRTVSDNQCSHASGHNNKVMVTGGNSMNTVGDAFVIGNGTSSTAKSNAFRVTFTGDVYGRSTFKTSGADYAEYFEWEDNNPDNEDRVGHFVTLDNNKIRIASSGDYILGVVSGHPCIIGNADEDWLGRWEHDKYGRFIKEYLTHESVEVDIPEDLSKNDLKEYLEKNEITFRNGKYYVYTTTVVDYETDSWRYKANPNYDCTQKYIERQDRPEWDAVGMLGVLSVIDDGTCRVNEFCKVTEDGIATAVNSELFISENKIIKGYRVIERVDDNTIKIIFR